MKKEFIYSVVYFIDSHFCEFRTSSHSVCKQFINDLFYRGISYRLRIDEPEKCK